MVICVLYWWHVYKHIYTSLVLQPWLSLGSTEGNCGSSLQFRTLIFQAFWSMQSDHESLNHIFFCLLVTQGKYALVPMCPFRLNVHPISVVYVFPRRGFAFHHYIISRFNQPHSPNQNLSQNFSFIHIDWNS